MASSRNGKHPEQPSEVGVVDREFDDQERGGHGFLVQRRGGRCIVMTSVGCLAPGRRQVV